MRERERKGGGGGNNTGPRRESTRSKQANDTVTSEQGVSEPHKHLGEELSRQREQQIARPGGRRVSGVFGERREASVVEGKGSGVGRKEIKSER